MTISKLFPKTTKILGVAGAFLIITGTSAMARFDPDGKISYNAWDRPSVSEETPRPSRNNQRRAAYESDDDEGYRPRARAKAKPKGKPLPMYIPGRIPDNAFVSVPKPLPPVAKAGPSKSGLHPRVEEAFRYFVSQGWSAVQAAGIVGNLMAETGPNLAFETVVGDRGTSFGLAQWRFERVSKFRDIFGVNLRGSTFQQQLAYVQWELTQSWYKTAGDMLRKAQDHATAATIVDVHYERSAGWHRGVRIANAKRILDRHHLFYPSLG